ASPQSAVSGSAAGASSGRSGPAIAVSDSVKVSAISEQTANANGAWASQSADPPAISTAAIGSAGGATSPPPTQMSPALGVTASTRSGTQASSGAVLAVGMQTSVDVRNLQTSVCVATEAA